MHSGGYSNVSPPRPAETFYQLDVISHLLILKGLGSPYWILDCFTLGSSEFSMGSQGQPMTNNIQLMKSFIRPWIWAALHWTLALNGTLLSSLDSGKSTTSDELLNIEVPNPISFQIGGGYATLFHVLKSQICKNFSSVCCYQLQFGLALLNKSHIEQNSSPDVTAQYEQKTNI